MCKKILVMRYRFIGDTLLTVPFLRNLKDAYTMSGNGPGLSYNRSGMYFRIDNIFISDSWKPYGATVDRSIKESDHYPIYCYLHKR